MEVTTDPLLLVMTTVVATITHPVTIIAVGMTTVTRLAAVLLRLVVAAPLPTVSVRGARFVTASARPEATKVYEPGNNGIAQKGIMAGLLPAQSPFLRA